MKPIPLNSDTDGDGLLDGQEDANGNGVWWMPVKPIPLNSDTDGDGRLDGHEDVNSNGGGGRR